MNDKNSTVNGCFDEWTILSLYTVFFFFKAQFLFNASGGLMIQCWCWLKWKKKVAILYIYLDMRVVGNAGWMNYGCIGVYMSRMALYGKSYLNARMKLRLSCRMLDLRYQQSEPEFVQNPKPRWFEFLLFCQLSMYGEGYCMWEYFSHFWRE